MTVSSPDGNKFDGEIVKLDIRGVEGELGIMAGHIPFMTSVVKGECILNFEDGSRRKGHSDGGILSVSTEQTVLIAGSFEFIE